MKENDCKHNLESDPVTFVILDNIECELSFVSGKGFDLKMDNQRFNDLEKHKVEAKFPRIAQSSD